MQLNNKKLQNILLKMQKYSIPEQEQLSFVLYQQNYDIKMFSQALLLNLDIDNNLKQTQIDICNYFNIQDDSSLIKKFVEIFLHGLLMSNYKYFLVQTINEKEKALELSIDQNQLCAKIIRGYQKVDFVEHIKSNVQFLEVHRSKLDVLNLTHCAELQALEASYCDDLKEIVLNQTNKITQLHIGFNCGKLNLGFTYYLSELREFKLYHMQKQQINLKHTQLKSLVIEFSAIQQIIVPRVVFNVQLSCKIDNIQFLKKTLIMYLDICSMSHDNKLTALMECLRQYKTHERIVLYVPGMKIKSKKLIQKNRSSRFVQQSVLDGIALQTEIKKCRIMKLQMLMEEIGQKRLDLQNVKAKIDKIYFKVKGM